MRDIRLASEGELRREKVSLAAAFGPEWCKGPLIFRGQVPDDDDEDQPA